MTPAAPHGFELTPDDHRLLRGAPPVAALRWAGRAAGAGARIVRFAALPGGTSSAVHGLDLRMPGGAIRGLVLRRFVRADWLAEEPDVARREAAALELLRAGPVPAPELVAVDEDGSAAGAPAVLMTRLAGAVEWRPADLDGFLRGLAALLPAIHATPLRADAAPAAAALPAYDPYALEVRRPPVWSTRPDMWERAFAIFDGPAPAEEPCFIHRDFHPGNVLWRDGAVSGLVDWASASVGAPSADVGHCRWNLANALGLGAADHFLALTGLSAYDPYWDVVAVLGGRDGAALDAITPREEAFLARAVA